VKVEDENDVTTNLGVSSDEWFGLIPILNRNLTLMTILVATRIKTMRIYSFPVVLLIQLYIYCPNRPRIHFYAMILVL
jgi:hypothetical protein